MTGPTELNVYQTSRCNARCSMCLRQHGLVEDAPDVETLLLSRVLEVFPTLKSATVAGFGEPLLSPSVGDVCSYLQGRGLYVGLITNGIELPGREDEVKRWGLGHVSVSLNAADADERAALGMPGDWRELLRSIDTLHHDLAVRISFVVSRQNIGRVFDYLDVAEQLGVDCDFVNLLPHCGLEAGNALGFWRGVLLDDDLRDVRSLREHWQSHSWAEHVGAWPVPLDTTRKCECQSPYKVVGVDGAGSMTICRRVIPPQRAAGIVWGHDPFNSQRFTKHRAAMEHNDWKRIPDACRMCFGRGVHA